MRILIFGRVQGVGFRFRCKGLARKLNIKGTVQNLENGSVEIIASSENKDNLDQFIKEIKDGTFLSNIKNIKIEKIDQNLEDIEGFSILR